MELYLKIPYWLLEHNGTSFEGKIILAYLLSLQSQKRNFWGSMNYFERFGISAEKAKSIFDKMEEQGILWSNSERVFELNSRNHIREHFEWKE